jgi:hypothetical protein
MVFTRFWRKYGILKDLFDMGLKGKLPNFISNFLSDREFNVGVNSTYSDNQEQEMGHRENPQCYRLKF